MYTYTRVKFSNGHIGISVKFLFEQSSSNSCFSPAKVELYSQRHFEQQLPSISSNPKSIELLNTNTIEQKTKKLLKQAIFNTEFKRTLTKLPNTLRRSCFHRKWLTNPWRSLTGIMPSMKYERGNVEVLNIFTNTI